MNKTFPLFALLLLILIGACGKRDGNGANSNTGPNIGMDAQKGDSTEMAVEAQKQYEGLAYYYNNNIAWTCAPAAGAKSLQSCPTLCDPIDGSPPGPAVPGIPRQEHWSGLPFPPPMHESEK